MIRNVLLVWLSLAVIVTSQELTEKQRGVAERYGQLEQILLRMSEASATSNPRRAELLKKVLVAGKDKLVALRLESVVDILQRRQLTEAIAGQEGVEKDLLELLKLLESENRDQRRQFEKEKIKEFLRDLEEIIHQEKALKSRTAQEEDEKLKNLEKNQRDVRLRAQTLRNRIDEHDRSEAPSDAKPEDQEKPDHEKTDDEKEEKTKESDKEKQSEKAPDKAAPKDDEEKPASESEKKETQQEKSEQKKTPSAESEQSKGDKGDEKVEEETDEKDDANDSPTQKAMKKAMQRMKQAEQKLQKAEKSPALEDQEEAIAELQRAKAELEKILRQLREEELLQTLEKLEARFKRMLKVEQSIRAQTEKLAPAPTEASDERSKRIQASRIAVDQLSVLDDADAALVLLREDGTAQAMVESLLQARFDMEEIKARLDKTQLDSVTLDIEDTVIAALQEMLEAIDMAIKEAEKRKENPPPQDSESGGGEETEPLIQILSELKMIRSMQKRVNERTQRCDKAIEETRNDPTADLDALRKKVEELARQQNRISRILNDLKVGKSR